MIILLSDSALLAQDAKIESTAVQRQDLAYSMTLMYVILEVARDAEANENASPLRALICK